MPSLGARFRRRKIGAEREHRHLRFAEWRSEILIRLTRIHPSAEYLLPSQQVVDGLSYLGMARGNAGGFERPQRVSGLKFNLGLLGIEAHGPLPIRTLER